MDPEVIDYIVQTLAALMGCALLYALLMVTP